MSLVRLVTQQSNRTPQSQKLRGKSQVRNSAGGFSFKISDWERLNRFLVLGSEGGSYYTTPQKLTKDNTKAVLRCIELDGERVIRQVVKISTAGRAPKNDPALFVLALCASAEDAAVRCAALEVLPNVARIGTHLFHFMAFVEQFRGWGRGLRRAIGNWYNDMDAGRLAYQAIKYQQRDGWSHRDALRLAHPQAATVQHNAIYHWITQGWPDVGDAPHEDPSLVKIWAFERAKRAEDVAEIVALITEYRLPWEAVPTQFLREAQVWEALLPTMPMTAMIRNLARMTNLGVLKAHNDATGKVIAKLRDANRLRKARLHPIQVLAALTTYSAGRGARGKLTWVPIPQIIDALDAAFYKSFGNVKATGKRFVLGLDVSGSMGAYMLSGVPGLSARIGSAAMALVTAATEPTTHIMGFQHKFVPLSISPRQRLDDVVKSISGLPFGRTDCAKPMQWALDNHIEADVFIVYTDNETWSGAEHPVQALQRYRRHMGIPAKLIVVGMAATKFSIADQNDAGMLDVVGFDTAVPNLMADFIRA
ncbi:MAG: TROVE domain-containing protein [Candidatus Promineifilaceae bacterium]